MTSFRVPQSKYRHVFSTSLKRELCYEDFRYSTSSCDNPLCAANPKFLAFCIDCGGGGAFQAIPLSKNGRLSAAYPRFDAHSGDILDIQFNPFDDNMVATCSDDTTVKVWEIPEGEMTHSIEIPFRELNGHQKKVHIIEWHPSAANVLLSAGGDNLVLIWNVLNEEAMFHVEVPEQLFCVSWSWNGKYFATSSKDLFIRLYDPRKEPGQQMIQITSDKAHEGKKQMQIKCLKNDRLVSTGFGKQSVRQYALWSISTEAGQPTLESGALMEEELDQTSGVLFIIYDPDSNMIYLVGRGDTTIRLYEVKSNDIVYLNLQNYPQPHKGVASLPKRGLNIMSCEIMRFYRVLPNKNMIEVVSWTVPRKSDMFQADLYPDTAANRPAIEADEWQTGVDADPIMAPVQSLVESPEDKKKSKPGGGEQSAMSRAEMIAARAQARVQQAADEKYGQSGGGGQSKMSRYDREREAAGLLPQAGSSSNGHSGGSSDKGGEGDGREGQSGKHIAQLVDEMRKLTLVVKAHEARIKQLEEQLEQAQQNNQGGNNNNNSSRQELNNELDELAIKNGIAH